MKKLEVLKQYEYLWENSNDILYIHDLGGKILKVNRKALELFSYKPGTRIWDWIDPEYWKVAEEKLDELLENGKPVGPYEILCRARDERKVWLEVVSHPVFKNRRIAAVFGIARDVSEVRGQHFQIRSMKEQLERNMMLIAHLVDRIRNPLTVLRFYSETDERINNKTRKKMMESIDKIDDLVSNLDHAWIDSEKLRDLLFEKRKISLSNSEGLRNLLFEKKREKPKQFTKRPSMET